MKLLVGLLLINFLTFKVKGYEQICYHDHGLGCYTDAPPWGDTSERPIGHVPNSPDKINTRFYLDTRLAEDVEVYNDDMSRFGQTTFNPTKPTKLIIHGFIQNGATSWMHDMSRAFRNKEDVNVIRVGWFGGSLTLKYAQSATDIQVVGAEVGLFIKNIMEHFNGDPKLFHCIGHSLGAQACGYAGNAVNPDTIARITGLDPAGPYFEGTPVEVRLDSSDADFVDVIHSDAEPVHDLGMGTNQVSGHIDFWPNKGIDQPGCNLNILSTIIDQDGLASGIRNVAACDHLRSVFFFLESITSSCNFTSNACPSYEDYLVGKCLQCLDGKCPSMGYGSIHNKDVIYQSEPNHYLQTRANSPYCSYMVYVEVKLGGKGDTIDGNLHLTLYGDDNENTEQVRLSKSEDTTLELLPYNKYSYFAQFNSFPTNFNKVKLLWTTDEWSILKPHITVDTITLWVNFQQKTYTFCGDSSSQLEKDTRYSYYQC